MSKRRCRHCRCTFQLLRNPNQHYCSKSECQRSRRCRWQHQKCKKDSDYQANSKRSQQAWRKGRADYYQRYRKSHPDYTTRNKMLQRERNRRNRSKKVKDNGEDPKIAKTNALLTDLPLLSIPYQEFSGQMEMIAKMYALKPEILQLSSCYRHFYGRPK
jgi:hypothetical protein